MIITISRICGCEADKIGESLGNIYNIPFYNKKRLIDMAKEKGIYYDHLLVYSEIPVDVFEAQNVEKDLAKNALMPIIGQTDCVVVGRGADAAFKDRDDCISIFLTGSLEKRAAYIAKKHDISTKKAIALIEQTDYRRREFYHYSTGQQWGHSANYNLCIDTTKLSTNQVIELIKNYVDATCNNLKLSEKKEE